MKKGYYYFIFMFICTFFYITNVSADETKTCYYNDGKGNEGQFSYVKTNNGYEFGNQYAIYDDLRSTNWAYRKDENTQDVLAWSSYTIKNYFSKGQCAPYLIYFKANGTFTSDDSTEIFPGDSYVLEYDYTNYYSKKDWDNNDTLNLIPLVDTKENELSKFSTLLGQNIKDIKSLLNGECKNGNKSIQCINKFVTIRSSSVSLNDKYNRLLELGKISSSDKEYSQYNNDYLKLLEQAKKLYKDVVITETEDAEKKDYDCYYVSSDNSLAAGYKFNSDVYVVKGKSKINNKKQKFPKKTTLLGENKTDKCYNYLYYTTGKSGSVILYKSYLGNGTDDFSDFSLKSKGNLLTLVGSAISESEKTTSFCSLSINNLDNNNNNLNLNYDGTDSVYFKLFTYADGKRKFCTMFKNESICSDTFETSVSSIKINSVVKNKDNEDVTFELKNDGGFSCSNFSRDKVQITKSGNNYIIKLKEIKKVEKNADNNKDNDMDLSGCIIDEGTQSIIDWIMNLVRIGGVILLVVLGMLDFVKAAASGEQEEMKKSKSKFVKRLIACVVLFFVPIIVKILVGLVNLGSGENCNSNDSNDKTDDSNNRVSYQCSCKYYRSNVDEPNISDVSLSFDVTNKDNFDSHIINYNGKNVTVKINSPQKNATSSTDMLCPKNCSFDESKKVLTCSSTDNDETFQNNNPHFYQAADENGKLLENCKILSN